jgi:hypothetical protein
MNDLIFKAAYEENEDGMSQISGAVVAAFWAEQEQGTVAKAFICIYINTYILGLISMHCAKYKRNVIYISEAYICAESPSFVSVPN